MLLVVAWRHRGAWLTSSDTVRSVRFLRVMAVVLASAVAGMIAVTSVRHEAGAGAERMLSSAAIGAGLGAAVPLPACPSCGGWFDQTSRARSKEAAPRHRRNDRYLDGSAIQRRPPIAEDKPGCEGDGGIVVAGQGRQGLTGGGAGYLGECLGQAAAHVAITVPGGANEDGDDVVGCPGRRREQAEGLGGLDVEASLDHHLDQHRHGLGPAPRPQRQRGAGADVVVGVVERGP